MTPQSKYTLTRDIQQKTKHWNATRIYYNNNGPTTQQCTILTVKLIRQFNTKKYSHINKIHSLTTVSWNLGTHHTHLNIVTLISNSENSHGRTQTESDILAFKYTDKKIEIRVILTFSMMTGQAKTMNKKKNRRIY